MASGNVHIQMSPEGDIIREQQTIVRKVGGDMTQEQREAVGRVLRDVAFGALGITSAAGTMGIGESGSFVDTHMSDLWARSEDRIVTIADQKSSSGD